MANNVIFVYRMFMDTPEDEKTKLISCLGAFRQFWGGLSQVSTAFLIYSADDFWRPPLFFLHLLRCCNWGLSRKGEVKLSSSFVYSCFISFDSYSSGEPVLESQVDDSSVWDFFFFLIFPMLDYIKPFLSYSDLFGALGNICVRDYKEIYGRLKFSFSQQRNWHSIDLEIL